jgi:hypothetical protein
MLGETDLGFVQIFANVKFGWFHPSAAGEKVMPVLTGVGPALHRLYRMERNPVRALMRGLDHHPDGEFPRDIRRTTAYADLVSIGAQIESMALELRGPDGKLVETDDIHIDDTEWKRSLVPKKHRVDLPEADPLEMDSAPLPRYQIQVRLRGIPRRRLHAPGLDD